MNFCINEMCLAQQGDLLSHIEECAAQDIKSMEVSKNSLIAYLRDGGTLETLGETFRRSGVAPVCVNSIESISFNTKRGMRVLREMSEFLFYCCRCLNCQCVEVIGSFKVPTKDEAQIEEETVQALRLLSDAAKPYGIRLALEYMGVADSSVFRFAQALSIVRKTGRENVGLLVDTWHHYASGSAPEELLEAAEEEIYMVHISDCPACRPGEAIRTNSLLPGQGDAPLQAMLENLSAIGYRGPVSAEVFAPSIRGLEPAEYISRTKAATMPLLKY